MAKRHLPKKERKTAPKTFSLFSLDSVSEEDLEDILLEIKEEYKVNLQITGPYDNYFVIRITTEENEEYLTYKRTTAIVSEIRKALERHRLYYKYNNFEVEIEGDYAINNDVGEVEIFFIIITIYKYLFAQYQLDQLFQSITIDPNYPFERGRDDKGRECIFLYSPMKGFRVNRLLADGRIGRLSGYYRFIFEVKTFDDGCNIWIYST